MGDVTFGVGQITSLDAGELESIKEQLLPQMESECGKHGIEMVFFMLTNIIEESTELLYYGSGAKEVIEKAFEDLPVNEVSCELKGVVSRKKQTDSGIYDGAAESVKTEKIKSVVPGLKTDPGHAFFGHKRVKKRKGKK